MYNDITFWGEAVFVSLGVVAIVVAAARQWYLSTGRSHPKTLNPLPPYVEAVVAPFPRVGDVRREIELASQRTLVCMLVGLGIGIALQAPAAYALTALIDRRVAEIQAASPEHLYLDFASDFVFGSLATVGMMLGASVGALVALWLAPRDLRPCAPRRRLTISASPSSFCCPLRLSP